MALQIGITGGIGSGKSLVCKMFNSLGVPSYDADSRAKRLMTTDGILVEAIEKEFGSLSYHKDGQPFCFSMNDLITAVIESVPPQ